MKCLWARFKLELQDRGLWFFAAAGVFWGFAIYLLY